MKVWIVRYAYEGGLMGLEVFDSYEKAKIFLEMIKKEHAREEGFYFFVEDKEVK